MSSDKSTPIILNFKSAKNGLTPPLVGSLPEISEFSADVTRLTNFSIPLRTFDSYSFQRSVLTPAAPFRFTAPGVDAKTRMAIRSGDTVELLALNKKGDTKQIAVGYVDETDTHVSATRVEYVITGRDTLGQLVDNASVDIKNKVTYFKATTLDDLLVQIIKNTRIPQKIIKQSVPSGSLLFVSSPTETKMNSLQRYLEITNCLVWTKPNGQVVIGKPNFAQLNQGILTCGQPSLFLVGTNPNLGVSNVVDVRVRRNINTAIRTIIVQLQTAATVDGLFHEKTNSIKDIRDFSGSNVGRSIFEIFTYSKGNDATNQLTQVGTPGVNSSSGTIGEAKALREIARSNVQVLDVEITVQGHFNENGEVYDVDQMYIVNVPDEDIEDPMYVYEVTHELTLDHGMITKLRLCRPGTIVADAPQIPSLF